MPRGQLFGRRLGQAQYGRATLFPRERAVVCKQYFAYQHLAHPARTTCNANFHGSIKEVQPSFTME